MQADAAFPQAVSCGLFDIQRTCTQATWRKHGCSTALMAGRVFDRIPWPLVGVAGGTGKEILLYWKTQWLLVLGN